MARNKFDVDENLESPFSFAHLKRAMKYVKKHAFKMVLALVLSCIASVVALFGPKIMQWALDLSLIHISRMDSSVDLPQPLGPTMLMNSPLSMENDMFSRAVTSPFCA